MKKKFTIFLDMDGVCCNFVDGVFKTLGETNLIGTWPKKAKNLEEVLKIKPIEYWEKIDKLKSKFWFELEEYSWFEDLYKKLSKYGKVIFLTCPSRSPESVKGKLEWLHERFGKGFREYIFTEKKYYVAKKETILIDDFEKNCKKFEKNGGNSILFPQKWNEKGDIPNKVEYVIKKIKSITDELPQTIPICAKCAHLEINDYFIGEEYICLEKEEVGIYPVTGERYGEECRLKNKDFSCTKFKEKRKLTFYIKLFWNKLINFVF